MQEDTGLVFGWVLDGRGGGRRVGWDHVEKWRPEEGTLWLHLDRRESSCETWLSEVSGLDAIVVDALLAEETRPRTATIGDGLLMILRGVNLNPGADPEDMVSLRLWIEERRAISVRARVVMAATDVDHEVEAGRGPRSSSELLGELATRLVDRMAPVIEELDDVTDSLEDQLLTEDSREIRHQLRDVRRTAIALRRYLAPQRDAVSRLQVEELAWLDHRQKARMREVTDLVIRYVEDLDEVRERASLVQEELVSRVSEQMNRNMYLLSLVATVMLPLGFLTGLLGINVGGIPGADSPLGFLVVCGILGLIAVLEIAVLRRLHWF